MAMNLKDAQKPTGDFGVAKAGSQVGVLAAVVNLGKQKREYKGKPKPSIVQLNFTFELPGDVIETEEGEKLPRWISMNRVSFTNGDKATLTQVANALDPNDECEGELGKMLGRGVFLNIKHKEKKGSSDVYAKIDTLMPVPDGIPVPALADDPILFDFYTPDIAQYQRLPAWIKDIIKEAEDFPGSEIEKLIQVHGEDADEAEAEQESDTDVGGDVEDRPY